jgi:hypothetical protein
LLLQARFRSWHAAETYAFIFATEKLPLANGSIWDKAELHFARLTPAELMYLNNRYWPLSDHTLTIKNMAIMQPTSHIAIHNNVQS